MVLSVVVVALFVMGQCEFLFRSKQTNDKGTLFMSSQAFLFRSYSWDGLKVTWDADASSPRSFAALPRTETEARHAGFVKVSDCGVSPLFTGKRYMKDNDTAVVLLYDTRGYIAGIQAGFPKTQPNGFPFAPLKNHPFVLYEDHYYITAYFVNPDVICGAGRRPLAFSTEGTGIDLFIQNGTSHHHVVKIPHRESSMAATKWTKGKCFPTMGMHYWYNTAKDMSCDYFYPVFLLYNGGKLNAFGWAFATGLSSTRYEHPTPQVFGAFMDPVPDCLSHQGTLSTMHIYLTNTPENNKC